VTTADVALRDRKLAFQGTAADVRRYFETD
jgi:hypothetical protein